MTLPRKGVTLEGVLTVVATVFAVLAAFVLLGCLILMCVYVWGSILQ